SCPTSRPPVFLACSTELSKRGESLWTEPFWLNLPSTGRLALSAHPRGDDWLEPELRAWRSLGPDGVISLLTVEESDELVLERESEACRSAGIEYCSFPIVGRGVPVSAEQLLRLVCEIAFPRSRERPCHTPPAKESAVQAWLR